MRRALTSFGVAVAGIAVSGCFAVTQPATQVAATSARLNAYGATQDLPATPWFEYSDRRANLGTPAALSTPGYEVPAKVGPAPYFADVSGLAPGRNYLYRACGQERGGGQLCANTRAFVTPVPGAVVAWAPYEEVPCATGAQHLVTTSVDRDAVPDAVVADPAHDAILVCLGRGDGSYAPPVSYPAGPAPGDILLFDMNGDGRRDLVVSDEAAGAGVSVLPALAGGGYGPPVRTPLKGRARAVAALDAGVGDSSPDLVVALGAAGSDPSSVAVLPGRGDGSFGAPVYHVTGRDYVDVDWTTIQGSRQTPAAAFGAGGTGGDGGVETLYLAGDGSVTATHTADARYDPVAIAHVNLLVSDANDVDIVVLARSSPSSPGRDRLVTLVNPGDGRLYRGPSYDLGGDGSSVTAAHLTAVSSREDIVVADRAGGRLGVLLGKDSGTLEAPVWLPVGASPGSVDVGDANQDGRFADLATPTSGGISQLYSAAR